MRKIIFLINLMFVFLFVSGQKNKPVEQLLREARQIRKECDDIKDGKKEKTQGYELALKKQDTVILQLQKSVESYKKYAEYEDDAMIYRFLSRTDTIVFIDNETIKSPEKLPPFMRNHYYAILVIRKYYQCIKNMEETIDSARLNKNLINEQDRKSYIALMIKSDINEANDVLDNIEKINMLSFSDEQTKFYQNLSNKLSDIIDKYIF